MRRPGVASASARSSLRPVAALALAGCAADSDTPQNIFDPKGSQAQKINNLQVPVFIVAGVVGVIVIVDGRRDPAPCSGAKKHPDDEVPTQIHGNSKLEIAWTIMPGVILLLVAVSTVATVFDLAQKPEQRARRRRGRPAVVVGVRLPRPRHRHGQRDGDPGRAATCRCASARATSSTRSGSPRSTASATPCPAACRASRFEADTPGEYWGQCTEFCGLSHANMRIRAVALSPDDFDAWVANQQKPAAEPADGGGPGRARRVHRLAAAARATRSTASTTRRTCPLVAGAAPNLTHLMSRTTFAGATYTLITPELRPSTPPGPTGTPVRVPQPPRQLEAWLRDPDRARADGRRPAAAACPTST